MVVAVAAVIAVAADAAVVLTGVEAELDAECYHFHLLIQQYFFSKLKENIY